MDFARKWPLFPVSSSAVVGRACISTGMPRHKKPGILREDWPEQGGTGAGVSTAGRVERALTVAESAEFTLSFNRMFGFPLRIGVKS